MVAPVQSLQTIIDGARNNVIKADFVSGGADQPLTKIVDVASMNPRAGISLKVRRIKYDVTPGGILLLYWDAGNPQLMLSLNGFDEKDFTFSGGLTNNATGPGVTGSILAQTQGFTLGYQYSIVISSIKGV